MIKNKIVGLIIATTCIFIMSPTLTANASNSEQQHKKVVEEIKNNEDKLKVLEEDFKNTNDEISKKERDLVDLTKEAQAKKQVVNHSNNINGLKMFEIVLKSDNMSELMSNLKTVKQLMLLSNKSIVDNTKKEEILKTEHIELNDKQRELENEILNAKNKKEELDSKKTEIELSIKKEKEAKEKENTMSINVETHAIYNNVVKGELKFNPNNITEASNATADDLYKALKGTALYELAPVYIEAERLYGVNAFFMMGLCAQESAWGTSYRAVHDNNLTGFGVYSDSSTGINSKTKRDNILGTASWLKRQYLTPGGLYYNGKSIRAVNTRYCIGKDGKADYHWSDNITRIATDLVNKI